MANLSEAYNGFSIGIDKRKLCCGAQFKEDNRFVTVGIKRVNIASLKSILERNSSLRKMNLRIYQPVWVELGLTKLEYQQVKSKLRK